MSRRTSAAASLLLTGFLTVASPSAAAGQATAPVPLHHRAYDDLEILHDEGLLRTPILGQRPYSRRAIAVAVAEARTSSLECACATERAARSIDRLAAEFATGLAGADGRTPRASAFEGRVDRMALEYAALDSPERAVPDAGLGKIDARINPLASNRSGRALVNGHSMAVEADYRLQAGRFVALAARPRLWAADPREGATEGGIVLPSISARVVMRNLAVEVGRLETVFGRDDDAALALSANARPLAAVKIESDLPFRLPWILGSIGWARATFLTADLGPDQNYPGARLTAYKGSLRMNSSVELGLTAMNHWGGQGGPAADLGERVIDILPLVDAVFMADRDVEISNKLAGIDVHVRSDRLRGAQAYAEVLLDDFDHRRLRSVLVEDAGWITGLRLPNLAPDRSVALRTEFHHTGLRFYQHHQFRSGVTYERGLIGSALGPRGKALYIEAGRTTGNGNWLALRAAIESRGNDQYVIVGDPPDYANFGFELRERRPTELRDRVTLSFRRSPRAAPSLVVRGEVGFERVRNFDFIAGRNRRNGLLLTTLEKSF